MLALSEFFMFATTGPVNASLLKYELSSSMYTYVYLYPYHTHSLSLSLSVSLSLPVSLSLSAVHFFSVAPTHLRSFAMAFNIFLVRWLCFYSTTM